MVDRTKDYHAITDLIDPQHAVMGCVIHRGAPHDLLAINGHRVPTLGHDIPIVVLWYV